MDVCGSGHEDICYNGRKCPLCIEISGNESMQVELDSSKEMYKELEDRYNDLVIEKLSEIVK